MEKVTQQGSRADGDVVALTEAGEGPAAVFISSAIETIGMGRYQWQLLFTCGFGYLVDQVYPLHLRTNHGTTWLTGFW